MQILVKFTQKLHKVLINPLIPEDQFIKMVCEMRGQVAYTKGFPALNSLECPKPAIESLFAQHPDLT